MNIHSIKLKNFLSHRDTEVSFDSELPYLLVGENGSGKSSLITDSITYALFGSARARGAGDDLISGVEKKCSVELIFDVNGTMYRVVRERERGKKTALFLFKRSDGIFKDMTNPTATVTQGSVEKIIGFNNDIFCASACLEQDSKVNFSSMTPKQCKEILMRLLDIGKYSDYEAESKRRMAEIEKAISEKRALVEFCDRQLAKYIEAERNFKDLSGRVGAIEKQIEVESARVSGEKEKLVSSIAMLEQRLAGASGKADELRISYKIKESQVSAVTSTIAVENNEILRLQQRAARLKKLGNKCPTCEGEVSHEHMEKLVDEILVDLGAREKTKATMIIEYDRLQLELQQIESAGRAEGAKEISAELLAATSELRRVSSDGVVESLKKKLELTKQELARAETELGTKKNIEGEASTARSEIGVLSKEAEVFSLLGSAFGRNGIPAMIISNAVDEFECAINGLLRRLTDKSISAKVMTEKNLKTSDALSDTLEVVIRDGIVERPYVMYSGGERFRIDLAIRLALSQILARRNNFKLETLIIDEPAYLDRSGLRAFKETVFSLSGMFKKIFIISHLTELVEDTYNKFNVVRVAKKNSASYVAMGG